MLGTSGTFMGTTRRLKELNPQSAASRCSPIRRFTASKAPSTWPRAIVPKIYDPTLADENLEIATEDAYAMARRLARDCGLLVGISAGAGIAGSLQNLRTASTKKRTAGGDRDHPLRLRRKVSEREILDGGIESHHRDTDHGETGRTEKSISLDWSIVADQVDFRFKKSYVFFEVFLCVSVTLW